MLTSPPTTSKTDYLLQEKKPPSKLHVTRGRKSLTTSPSIMVFLEAFEDFEKAAERIYLNAPMRTRCVMKYNHSNSCLKVKVTDDHVCVQYQTDSQQELKKLEKLISNLMKHMASGER